jgi:hypothetical protein
MIGLCAVGQITGCAQKGVKTDDFESSFLDYCRNERGADQWDSLEAHPDLGTKREFLTSQIRDYSNGRCQTNALLLYTKIASSADAANLVREVALKMEGQTADVSAEIIPDEAIKREVRFFLSENHPSKWPLLTQMLQAKNFKDAKTFAKCVAIAKKRIKNGEFSAEDVRSLESRF